MTAAIAAPIRAIPSCERLKTGIVLAPDSDGAPIRHALGEYDFAETCFVRMSAICARVNRFSSCVQKRS